MRLEKFCYFFFFLFFVFSWAWSDRELCIECSNMSKNNIKMKYFEGNVTNYQATATSTNLEDVCNTSKKCVNNTDKVGVEGYGSDKSLDSINLSSALSENDATEHILGEKENINANEQLQLKESAQIGTFEIIRTYVKRIHCGEEAIERSSIVWSDEKVSQENEKIKSGQKDASDNRCVGEMKQKMEKYSYLHYERVCQETEQLGEIIRVRKACV